MFCKSGILIFIFDGIYAHTMLIKRPLLHQSTGPCVCVCVCVSLSLSFRLIPEFTFLPRLLRPSREGALCLHPIERAPEAFMNRASPVPGALLAFCVNQGISASFSPLLSYCQLWTTRFWSIKGLQQTLKIKRHRCQPRSHNVI